MFLLPLLLLQKKALECINLKEIKAFPRVIQDLKNEELQQYMTQIEEGLANPDTFIPPPNVTFKLSELEQLGNGNLKLEATRLRKQVQDIVIKDIDRKYEETSPVKILTDVERYFLRGLRMPDDSPKYGQVANTLYWRATYENLCHQMEEYRAGKLQANDGLIRRLGFLAKNSSVPQNVKRKAQEFLQLVPKHSHQRR